jgi:GNAT superfamily N-acetyltransferase
MIALHQCGAGAVRWMPDWSSYAAGVSDSQAAEAKIRAARLEDAEALVAVQRSAELAALGHVFPPAEHPYPTQAVTQRWRTTLASAEASVLVAETGERAVGLACVASGWLRGLFVVPDAWGSGLADRLHTAAMAIVRLEGNSRCRLWVLEQNHRARRFYSRLGWRPDGRRQPTPFPPYPTEVGYALELGHPLDRRSSQRSVSP